MRRTTGPLRAALVAPLLASLVLLAACGQDTGAAPGTDDSTSSPDSADESADAGDATSPDPEAGTSPGASTRPRAGESPGAASGAGRSRFPALSARRQVGGLANPWDVQKLPGIGLLVGERESGALSVVRGDRRQQVDFPSEEVWASGETGLMGLAVDPSFASNRRFYTCQGGYPAGGGRDVRVVAWRLSGDASTATRQRVLLPGIDASTGRHGGCRLLILPSGALLVGTGDAAVASNPQDRGSLAGKVLALSRFGARPWRGNPWRGADDRERRFVHTYGHRNVQGLAKRPGGGVFSVEHGPDRDDEVNRLVKGGNYGWDPGPGYDEGVPMTDRSLPGRQIPARWSSGTPTLATSGAVFVRGRKWGAYNGMLAVAALKAERLVFMRFDPSGRLVSTRTPRATRQFGRLRSVTLAPNNDLLLTTANGSGDAIVRVRPRG